MIPFTLEQYGYIPKSGFSSFSYLIIIIPYSILIGYYTYNCRNIAKQYMIIVSISVCFVIVIDAAAPNSVVYAVGWQFAMQLWTLSYMLDSLYELGMLEWMNIRAESSRNSD
eukprot:Pgem_evm1s19565